MLLPSAQVALTASCLLSLAVASSYDFCACQTRTDGPLDDTKTKNIAKSCGDPYTYVYGPAGLDAASSTIWARRDSGPGPRFPGIFLQSIFGKIDGDQFHDLCSRENAGDSSCFNCASYQQNGPSQGGTFQCTE